MIRPAWRASRGGSTCEGFLYIHADGNAAYDTPVCAGTRTCESHRAAQLTRRSTSACIPFVLCFGF